MKFEPLTQEGRLEWKDGGVLLLKRLSAVERDKITERFEKGQTREMLHATVKAHIYGWEEINGKDDKPLPFNDITHDHIYEALALEAEYWLKLFNFYKGPLGNSKTGSNVSTIGNGTPAPAIPASSSK